MANYAYVRVSTREQNIDRQLAALEPYNIPKQNIFCDYQSGKDFDRPAYRKMLKRLKAGEHVIIKTVAWQWSLLCDFSCAPGRKTAAEGEWLSSPFRGCVCVMLLSC